LQPLQPFFPDTLNHAWTENEYFLDVCWACAYWKLFVNFESLFYILRRTYFCKLHIQWNKPISVTSTISTYICHSLFFAGSVWVYKEYEPNYDPSRGKYCNRTLYLFAFWLITSVYIVLGVITLCSCSISVAMATIAFQRNV
jgi:hypothetical protein